MGDVIGDLNKRRGQVEGMESSRSGARKMCIRDRVCGVAKAADFLDGIKNLGYQMAFKGGLSFNLGDIIIPEQKEALRCV